MSYAPRTGGSLPYTSTGRTSTSRSRTCAAGRASSDRSGLVPSVLLLGLLRLDRGRLFRIRRKLLARNIPTINRRCRHGASEIAISRGGLDDGMPFLRVGGRVGPEGELGAQGDGAADFALGHVFALDVELFAAEGADGAVWEVKRDFGGWIGAEIVVVFELMQEFARRDYVVARLVAFEGHARLALERSGNQGSG